MRSRSTAAAGRGGCAKISFVEPLHLDEPNAPLNRDPTFEALLQCDTSKAVGKVGPARTRTPRAPHPRAPFACSHAPRAARSQEPRPTLRRALAAGRAAASDEAVLHGPVQVDAQQPPGPAVRVQGVRPLPLRPRRVGVAA